MKYQDIKIIDILQDGRGVGKTPEKIAFIEGAIYKEICQIEIIEEKKNFYQAKKIKTQTPSPVETKPPCPYYYECGGCLLMDINYQSQIQIKKNLIKNALKKSCKIEIDQLELIKSKPYGYRNKIRLQITKDGKLAYNKKYSNELVPIRNCLLAKQKISENFLQIEEITKNICSKYPGSLKEITIRTNDKEILLNISIKDEKPINFIKETYKNSNYQINISYKNKLENITGKNYLTYQIMNKKFKISLNDFYQVNDYNIENLYKIAKEFIGKNKKVLDLYCGSATSSIAINDDNLIGVEINKNAIKDAKENAKINNLKNYKFLAKDAKSINDSFIKKEKIDTILVDPPRAGLDKQLIKTIGKTKTQKIVYISCNPQSLARDIKRLMEYGFKLKKIKSVDMFPQTMHVETVVLMSRK